MSKKTVILLILLILLLVGGVYAYFTYFKKSSTIPTFQFRGFPPTRELPQQPTETKLPTEKKTGVLSLLVSEPIIGPALSRDGKNIAYILRENGNVYRIGFDGKDKTRLSNVTIVGIYNAVWSPDRSKAFLSYEQNAQIKKLILDLGTPSLTSSIIPTSVRSAVWSRDGKFFYLLEELPEGVRLITANALGKNGKETLRIPLGDALILPHGGSSLFFTQPPSAFALSPLFQLNQANGAFKELYSGVGLTALPSPKGERVLIGKTTPEGTLQFLSVLNIKDGSETSFGIKTLPEKCAWFTESVIFCGAPTILPSNTVLPDDYYKGTVPLEDTLIKIDLTTTVITVYNVQGYDMQNVFADEAGQNVFFRDQKTDYLYRFVLP